MAINTGGATIQGTSNSLTTSTSGSYTDLTVTGQFISTAAAPTPPMIVSSNAVIANLNAAYLNGLQGTSSNTPNTVVIRDADRNFSANTITARLYGEANFATSITGAAQGNITSLGILSSLTVTGTISSGNATLGNAATANFFIGSGANLENIAGSNVVGTLNSTTLGNSSLYVGTTSIALNRGSGAQTLSDVSITGVANTANFADTVTGSAQANITSLGTLTGLVINGNLTVNGTTEYSNVSTLRIKDPLIELGGNPNGDPLSGNDGKDRGLVLHYFSDAATDAFIGWDNSNAEFTFGSNVTISSDVVTFNKLGNIRANNFIGNISGAAQTAVTAATVTSSAQPNITSVGTLVNLAVGTGWITASTPTSITQTWNNGSANFATFALNVLDTASLAGSDLIRAQVGGTNKFQVSKTGNVIASMFTGNANNLSNIPAANLIGSVANAANSNLANYATNVLASSQSNITSIGTLIGLNVDSGELAVGSVPIKVAQTWNNVDVLFTAITANITDTASPVDALLMDLKVNNVSQFSVSKSGNVVANNFIGNIIGNISGTIVAPGSNTQVIYNDTGNLGGSADFTFDENLGLVTAKLINVNTGTISSSAPVLITQTWNNGSATYAAIKENITDVTSLATSALIDLQVNNTSKFKVDKTGNVTAFRFYGSGVGISALNGGNIIGAVANATYATTAGSAGTATAATAATTAGTVTTTAQPNITSTGTLTGLVVSSGTLTATTPISVTQTWNNTSVAFTGIKENILDTASATTSLLMDLQVASTSKFKVSKSGDVTANSYVGDGSSLTSIAGANVTGTVANATYSASSGSTSTAIAITASSQPNITSTGTLVNLSVATGSLNASTPINITQTWANASVIYTGIKENITDSASNANSLLIDLQVGSTSKFKVSKGGNVTATYYLGNGSQLTGLTANTANFAGNVTVAEQPNITSLGNLTSLIVSGTSNFGANGNIRITGGIDGQLLKTDGLGNLSWVDASGGLPAGDDTEIQFNDLGSFGSDARFKFSMITGVVTAPKFAGSGANLTNIPASNIVGTVANANYAVSAGTITIAAQSNITSLGTLTSLAVTGNANSGNIYTTNANLTGTLNVTGNSNVGNIGATTGIFTGNISAGNASLGNAAIANYFIGSGANLTNIPAANIVGTVNVGVNAAAYAGNVTVAAQPNITSVGTLTSLTISGNITSGNAVLGNAAVANYFIGSGANLTSIPAANIVGTVANTTYAITAGVVATNAQPNITSVGTLTSLTVSGNITSGNAVLGNATVANYFIGSGANLTNIPAANIVGTVANATYAITAGVVATNAQPNITSVGTLTGLVVNSGPLTTSAPINIVQTWNSVSNSFTELQLDVTDTASSSSSKIINARVGGTTVFSVDKAGNIVSTNSILGNVASANYIGGTLTTAAQPNITSVGTLSSLTVTDNINTSNLIATGTISGPHNGTIGAGTANSGRFTFVEITTTANVTGNLRAGNAALGNLASANYFSGDGSLLSNLSLGSATVGYANLANFAGNITVPGQPNITSVGTLTSVTVSGAANVTGNINAGNIIANGAVAASSTTTGTVKVTGGIGVTGNIYAGGNIVANTVGSSMSVDSLYIGNTTYIRQSSEVVGTKTGATGTVDHSFLDGCTFYHSSLVANFTANFTNVPTTNNQSIVFIIVVQQGASPYIPNAVQIGGVAQTIKWLGATSPTGHALYLDVFAFTLLRINSGWIVTGQAITYG